MERRRMMMVVGMMKAAALMMMMMLALCAPPPSGAAPAPPRLCAPPPPPPPPPTAAPDCEETPGTTVGTTLGTSTGTTLGTPSGTSTRTPNCSGDTGGDAAMEGTGDPGATNGTGDAVGHLNEAPGDATTVVTSVPASPGGDKEPVSPHGDVAMEVTAQPGVTGGPGDVVGHLSEAPGDATTTVPPDPVTPGGDKALVGTRGDVAMEGTEDPGATSDPRDALGHLSEAPGDATTTVTSVPVTPGGDKVLVATHGDVTMEVTGEPGVTGGPEDVVGHLNEAPGDATTVVAFVTTSPGGDKVLVGTSGDIGMEVTGEPGVTGGPGDALGHLSEAPGDATTVVPPVTATPGGDKTLLANGSDVAMEGTEDPGATNGTGDTLGHLTEAPGDATTAIPSVPVTPGGDKALVGTHGDVAVEGTEETRVLCGPGDSMGHLNEAPGDATTVVAPVTTSPGSDKVLVATQSDVSVEGTEDPGVTGGPGDIVGHLNESPGDATTTVTSVPVSPGGDKALVGTQSDVSVEGTEDPGVTGGPGDTLGHLSEAPRDATTAVPSVPVTPGGDKALVATQSDVSVEGTEDPGVTGGPGDVMGHLNEAPGDATTVVPPVTTPPGGDKLLVATEGGVAMEGTAQPGVTGGPGDIVGHLNETPGDATTTVTSVPVTPGGDKALVATQSDISVGGTEDPGVTGGPGDTLGGVNEAPGDATTAVVTSVPASGKTLLANGSDVAMGGTEDPGATNATGDMVGHLTEAPGDATTTVTSVPATPGGDKALVANGGDVAAEGTEETRVLCGPGDTLGRVPDVPGDATTTVPPVPVTPGGDKALVATQSDVTVGGTEDPGVTGGPGDIMGHLSESPGDATTVVAPVTVTPGGDKALVATQSDVTMEGTEDPGVTGGPGDVVGHLNESPGDATTVVAPVTTPPGGDRLLVATEGGVAMEGTAQPDVTGGPGDIVGHLSEAPGDATTVVAFVTTSPGSDRVLAGTSGDVGMEVTGEPGVTGGPGDMEGHLNEAPGDATTTVPSVPVTPGSDKALVGTQSDIGMEVTGEPGVTGGPGDMVGHLSEAPGDATTVVPPVTATPGGDKALVATQSDVTMEGTGEPGATNGTGDTWGHLSEAPGDATTTVPPVPVTPGGDKVLVATQSDITVGGTEDPGATNDPRDAVGHLSEAPGDATTVVPPVTATPGGDKTLLANGSDVTMEGTEDPGATNDPRDALGPLTEAPRDATTAVPPAATPPGSDAPPMSRPADVTMGVAAPPTAPNCSWDSLGRVPDVPKDQSAAATTPPAPVTSPLPSSAPSRGDAIMVAPGGDVMAPPPCRGPAPHAALPVTAAPPPGLASSAPFPSWPRPLLLVPLLLLLP